MSGSEKSTNSRCGGVDESRQHSTKNEAQNVREGRARSKGYKQLMNPGTARKARGDGMNGSASCRHSCSTVFDRLASPKASRPSASLPSVPVGSVVHNLLSIPRRSQHLWCFHLIPEIVHLQFGAYSSPSILSSSLLPAEIRVLYVFEHRSKEDMGFSRKEAITE